ncbi:MAG: hypothetical protein GY854_31810 [Deltaproteobacteria bacterium]|nr:hypothetical protein [Deltaproteobacteria bacterium]
MKKQLSSLLCIITFTLISTSHPARSWAQCAPNYGLKWLNQLGGDNSAITQDDLASGLTDYFDPTKQTIIWLHGGEASPVQEWAEELNVVDDTKIAELRYCTRNVDLGNANQQTVENKKRNGLQGWKDTHLGSNDMSEYNLAYFDWLDFAQDSYWRLTAKIWGEDSIWGTEWRYLGGNASDSSMRYWCEDFYGDNYGYRSFDIEEHMDVTKLFAKAYGKIIENYGGGQTGQDKITVLAGSMGSHIAIRFAARWDDWKNDGDIVDVPGNDLSNPMKVMVLDPVLHIKHIEMDDLFFNEVPLLDMTIVEKMKTFYVRAHNKGIDMSVFKNTMPARIDTTYHDSYSVADTDVTIDANKARNNYREMTRYGHHVFRGDAESKYWYKKNMCKNVDSIYGGVVGMPRLKRCIEETSGAAIDTWDTLNLEYNDSNCDWLFNHIARTGLFQQESDTKMPRCNDMGTPGNDWWQGLEDAWSTVENDYHYLRFNGADNEEQMCYDVCKISKASDWKELYYAGTDTVIARYPGGDGYAKPINCDTMSNSGYYDYSGKNPFTGWFYFFNLIDVMDLFNVYE